MQAEWRQSATDIEKSAARRRRANNVAWRINYGKIRSSGAACQAIIAWRVSRLLMTMIRSFDTPRHRSQTNNYSPITHRCSFRIHNHADIHGSAAVTAALMHTANTRQQHIKSQSVCTLIHVLIVLVFLPSCPAFQLAAIIVCSWMSGLILGILSLQVVVIKIDIISKRNTTCGQINNVSNCAFFGKRDPVTNLSLLRAYCSSFYGSVVWDLSHSSTDAFCAIWRKGLRRIWNLPALPYNRTTVS